MKDKLCFGCMEHIREGMECPCGFKEEEYINEPHHLALGTMLRDRYKVGKVLGEGGFGITYVGRDTVLDMKVAVKEFYMSGYVNRNNTYSKAVSASIGTHQELFEKNREKFITEARVLAKFAEEEGIVGIRDFFEENNTAYIVMDFLTGETLRTFLKKEKRISWQKTLELMEPVLKSLGNVHRHNVIHRDISPDNIMLLTNGKIKLLDFGAAREVSQTDIKSLSVILKPGYAPEEQYRSKGKQGPWTDIYAICATMYVCIVGTVPEDSMERMFDDKLKDPHSISPECPVALSNVIMKGMAVRQNDRYQSMDELQADITRAVANPEDLSIAASAGDNHVNEKLVNAARGTFANGVNEVPAAEPAKSMDPYATVFAAEIKEEPAEKDVVEKETKTGSSVELEEADVSDKKVQEKDVTEQEGSGKKEVNKEKVDKKSIKPRKNVVSKDKETIEEKEVLGKKKSTKKIGIIAAVVVVGIILIASMRNMTGSNHSAFNQRNASEMEVKIDPDTEASESSKMFKINDTIFTLPLYYSDFEANGWEAVDLTDINEEIRPSGSTSSFYVELMNMSNPEDTIEVQFHNYGESYAKASDCPIDVVNFSIMDLPSGNNKITLGNGLVLGESSLTETEAAYSVSMKVDIKFSDSIEYEQHVVDGNIETALYVREYKDTKESILRRVSIKNALKEEDYAGKYVDEPMNSFPVDGFSPGIWIELERPTNDVTSGRIEAGVYLKSYLDDGWTIVEGPEYLPADSTIGKYVIVQADPRTRIQLVIINPTSMARAVEYCVVSRFAIQDFKEDDKVFLKTDKSKFMVFPEDNLYHHIQDINMQYTMDGSKYTIYPFGSNSSTKMCLFRSSQYENVWSISYYSHDVKGLDWD